MGHKPEVQFSFVQYLNVFLKLGQVVLNADLQEQFQAPDFFMAPIANYEFAIPIPLYATICSAYS